MDIGPSQSRLFGIRAPPLAREVEEVLELPPDRLDVREPAVSRSRRHALRRSTGRVADHAGAAAEQRDRQAAVPLELEQPEDRHEVADVERRSGRIEADVAGDRAAGREPRLQAVGGGMEHAPPAQLVEEPGRAGIERRHRTRARAVTRRAGTGGRSSTAPMVSSPESCRPASHGASGTAAVAPPGGDAAAAPLAEPRWRSRSSSSPASSPWAASPSSAPSPRTRTTAGTCPTRRSRSRSSASTSRRSSTTGPARSSSRASASASASSSRSTRSRPSSSTPRPRSRTRTSGATPASTSAASCPPRWTRSRAGPAAARRSPSSSSAPGCSRPEAFEGSIFERKAREIIQSIRLTQAFPEQEGKEQIITAYLNQNFYGNQSYGVQAAAKGYFGLDLKDLTLAQVALLAAIPQSPTEFDLVKNAVQQCTVDVAEGEDCPRAKRQLVVPADSAVVIRRNKVLALMETRSVLSGADHTLAEYEAAKSDPVVLVQQGSTPWKAAHFVWQVRSQLGAILCGEENADLCEKVDTGGYRIVTTLDWKMQQVVDKWLLAAARSPNISNPERSLAALKIPESEWDWLLKLKDRNIHNAAAAVVDYRTGEVLAYAGSAGYYAVGDETFQPQFDVLSDGNGRQPGSAIKPLNYITGIDDGTMTAATMFMDVVTDFGGQKPFTPTQADGLERGPVRLRSALQFSLNTPSIKAGLINGLDHLFQRFKDFGLTFPSGTIPVTSMSIGTLEVHPIDLTSAYGAIANGGVLMPRVSILKVTDSSGAVIYPTEEAAPLGKRVASAQASYIITDILQGNTITKVNPYWSKWRIVLEDGKRRPAAYKTGTTSDNKDVLAFGYLAPPEDPVAPALVVGVWMGNSDATPNTGSLSLDSSAPLWSRILTEISMGMPVGHVHPAGRPRDAPRSTPSAASCPGRTPWRRSRSCSSRAPSRRGRTTSTSSWTSTRRPASSGRTAARARWSGRGSSTSATSSSGSRAGSSSPRSGRRARRSVPARPAGRTRRRR